MKLVSRSLFGLAFGFLWIAAPNASSSPSSGPHVSPNISAAVIAGMPSYEPVSAPAEPPPSYSDVLSLPRLVVEGARTVIPATEQTLTPAALQDLLEKKYKNYTYKGQPVDSVLPNYAVLMHRDEVRLKQMQQLDALAEGLERTGNKAESKELRREMHRAFIRGRDWKTESMDKSVNHGRR